MWFWHTSRLLHLLPRMQGKMLYTLTQGCLPEIYKKSLGLSRIVSVCAASMMKFSICNRKHISTILKIFAIWSFAEKVDASHSEFSQKSLNSLLVSRKVPLVKCLFQLSKCNSELWCKMHLVLQKANRKKNENHSLSPC